MGPTEAAAKALQMAATTPRDEGEDGGEAPMDVSLDEGNDGSEGKAATEDMSEGMDIVEAPAGSHTATASVSSGSSSVGAGSSNSGSGGGEGVSAAAGTLSLSAETPAGVGMDVEVEGSASSPSKRKPLDLAELEKPAGTVYQGRGSGNRSSLTCRINSRTQAS